MLNAADSTDSIGSPTSTNPFSNSWDRIGSGTDTPRANTLGVSDDLMVHHNVCVRSTVLAGRRRHAIVSYQNRLGPPGHPRPIRWPFQTAYTLQHKAPGRLGNLESSGVSDFGHFVDSPRTGKAQLLVKLHGTGILRRHFQKGPT